ncbi:uncharacterized protein LOC124938448 [Impatiens glandulifera]|uniref:uncharacterized protein LOC124938448 n=1 Tax=Impatiens glandulifera TaxID=253017 RepID=UPI001FB06C48|nr:uncharacterized protein LOC124938448 [Impatiens glandulifera]
MVEDRKLLLEALSVEEWLSRVHELVTVAINKAAEVKGFHGRWRMIISRLEQIPSRLSDLSTHPFFSKNPLCKELLQTVFNSLNEATELVDLCLMGKFQGKLRMQSDLDSLTAKLDLNLQDCDLLIRTGVLSSVSVEQGSVNSTHIEDLLARIQMGNLESKHKALDGLVEVLKEDEKKVFCILNRNHMSALINLLTTNSTRIREKAVTFVCAIVESGNCENWLISEGVMPPLIRLVESGTLIGKEKATISIQRLSTSESTARSIVGHNGIGPLITICQGEDSVMQTAAVCSLKNIAMVPDVRQILADEGVVKVMINLMDRNSTSKEYAAECLQNLTSGNDELRRLVISEDGIHTLLEYIDNNPFPQEPAVAVLKNLVNLVPNHVLISVGLVDRLARVLRFGSVGAQQEAALVICRICGSNEMKRLVGEGGCISLLVKMLEVGKPNGGYREVAAQAIASLMTVRYNCKEVKKDEKSIPNLVQLLEPSPQNMAKKYSVTCLVCLSSSKKCKKLMISHGAIGYLKKLSEMEIPGAKKLLDRLEKGKISSLFRRK